MMLLGETWDAARAHAQGLVNRVVPARRLGRDGARARAQLAANVRAASVATKRLTLRALRRCRSSRFLAEYVRAQRGCWKDRETIANLARYRAGRWGS